MCFLLEHDYFFEKNGLYILLQQIEIFVINKIIIKSKSHFFNVKGKCVHLNVYL
jgi:hypothetical protein